MTEPIGSFLRRLAPTIYGPTMLFAIGEGVVLPLLPSMASKLGADLATSGLVASALVVGQLCGNLPASWLVARVGERIAMIVSGLLALGGAFLMMFAPSIVLLAVSIFVLGMCAAAFGLARHSFMTSRVPFHFRARALSLLGGTFRFGMFVGPFIAALLLWGFGTDRAAIWCLAALLIAAVLLVWLGPDPELEHLGASRVSDMSQPASPPTGIITTMVRHRDVLARLGVAAAALSAVRSARQVVLPIWGISIGLDAQDISLVVGIAGALDFALFYVSGQIMDRRGRLWAVVPAMLLMGVSLLVLGLTHDFERAAVWFVALSATIGLGNGLSSGILLTLGADVAPKHNPAPFLGSWRTLTDAGGAAAPVIFSGLTALVPIAYATGVIGLIGLVGAVGFIRWVPRFTGRR